MYARIVTPLGILLVATFANTARAQSSTKGSLCPSTEHSSMNILSSSDDQRRTWHVSWSTDDCSVDLRARGDFTFAPDLSDIASLSPGGYLEIVERNGDHMHRFEASRTGNGNIDRKWTVDGSTRPFDAEAQRWLGGMLEDIEHHTAFAAPQRVSALLAKGGVNAVLDEIENMEGDYARRVYFSTLLDSARLNEGDVRRVLQQSGKEISSDYELASLLVALGKHRLVTSGVADAYVTAANSLQSDYEHRRALTPLLEISNLQPAVVTAMFKSAQSIKSDYELASFLVDAANRGLVNDNTRDDYFTAAQSIESDYEYHRAMKQLLDGGKLSDTMLSEVLQNATHIHSDYERAGLLVSIAENYSLGPQLRDAYIRAADAISSDYEKQRALAALVRRTRL
jgi:hypothetical protein